MHAAKAHVHPCGCGTVLVAGAAGSSPRQVTAAPGQPLPLFPHGHPLGLTEALCPLSCFVI